jgi:hypothetical protein
VPYSAHVETLRIRSLPLSPPLRIFIGTRLLVWVVTVYAWVWFVPRPDFHGELGYVTQIWARGDSFWFIGIAQHGYEHNGGEVFYPLYPLGLAGLGRALGGYYVTAGIVISLACCAAAFVLLYKLALRHMDASAAGRAVLYLALCPMSLFLQAVYSESLYLLCAVGAFLLAERGRWLPAAFVTGLAMLTRVAGVALLPPMLLFAWRSPERRRAITSLAVAPLVAALYPLWLQLQLHAPRAAFSNEAGWDRHVSSVGPLAGLWHGVQAVWAGIEQLATGNRTHSYWSHSHADPFYVAAHNLEDFAFLLAFVALGIVAWRRIGAPYGLFVLGSLAIPLSAPPSNYPLQSMPRFCLPLFPAFLALALLATTARRDRIIVIASSAFLAIAAAEWATGQWVS